MSTLQKPLLREKYILKFDCILSFNYTSIYELLYDKNNINYCYIHAKSQIDKNETYLVFGTDDNLPLDQISCNSPYFLPQQKKIKSFT
ncbi:MAG: bacteriophage abortive infection AbiH family protein [Deltaproteobacteria bacterium]|jgi:hypothetical protein|nr:bacteriophage abortive infection AbiH family protein [Deltaproteobacteria bacterium]